MLWKGVKSINEYHIFILPDIYISRDDIISINNIHYEITGITEDYDVYLQDNNKYNYIYKTKEFIQLLKNNNYTFIRNIHNECIEKNKRI
jgi:hypothetical protein